jgi:hypothetical protein
MNQQQVRAHLADIRHKSEHATTNYQLQDSNQRIRRRRSISWRNWIPRRSAARHPAQV